MQTLHSINEEQRLFVIAAGRGYSCLGFDVTGRRLAALLAWLDMPLRRPVEPGSQEQWDAYQNALLLAHARTVRERCKCPIELTPELIGYEGRRVEVVDRNGERRRFIVGRSTGWMPCHLEVKRRDSSGGVPVTGAPFRSIRAVS